MNSINKKILEIKTHIFEIWNNTEIVVQIQNKKIKN